MSSEAIESEKGSAQEEAEQVLTAWRAWHQRRVVLHELNRLGSVYDPYESWLSGEQALDEFYLEDQLSLMLELATELSVSPWQREQPFTWEAEWRAHRIVHRLRVGDVFYVGGSCADATACAVITLARAHHELPTQLKSAVHEVARMRKANYWKLPPLPAEGPRKRPEGPSRWDF